MKLFEFDIDKYQSEWIFSPIRGKKDLLRLLLRVVKIMLIPNGIGTSPAGGKIMLHVEKMSRIFFISETKIFTINFPFYVTSSENGNLTFKLGTGPEIDNKVTSELIALLDSNNVFESDEFIQFVDSVDDACVMNTSLWPVLRDLLVFEDGYMRYDVDPKNMKGDMHPLHHLDVFYTASATFKIGLKKAIDQSYLADILRNATNCHYLIPTKT